ncbi:MAG: DUF4921 family protein [Deltaproteobacteria bacterium]|nr:DUF4921 family protein [Deltaproteobacteria bacterium]
MTEFRKDTIINRWVIIAAERARRPSDLAEQTTEYAKGGFCPFDVGNETATPPEVFAMRNQGTLPDTPGWQVRVVNNLYPALSVKDKPLITNCGLYLSMGGYGTHEVMIEGTDHEKQFADFDDQAILRVFLTWQERIRFHKKNSAVCYIQIFKNHGKRGGASLEHTHSQLVAMPFVPGLVEQEIRGAQDYFNTNNRCVYCDLLKQVRENKVYLVAHDSHVVSFCPHASRYPFETWVIPTQHQAGFEDADQETLFKTGRNLGLVLRSLNRVLNRPSYNFVLHTNPAQSGSANYHWHIEVIPITTSIAGFERATDCIINTMAPEKAAEFLREGL